MREYLKYLFMLLHISFLRLRGLLVAQVSSHTGFFWDFAHDLAPAVAYVFNSSLWPRKAPSSWKMADIKPLPKEPPLTSCTQYSSPRS